MVSITTAGAPVHFDQEAIDILKDYLDKGDFSSIYILVDTNTLKDCLPVFNSWFPELHPEVISIPAGEEHKHLGSCSYVWTALSNSGADRNSLLINLGGGVVCDLGGFVAATFKRGIRFINVPTTLLAMVDASVGGKTGVDLEGLKNQVGVIQDAEAVHICSEFLETLPEREIFSGFAEMLKHGLIRDRVYWDALKRLESPEQFRRHIHSSVAIKAGVVQVDPREKGLRKILNFGHTLGHAIESYFLERDELPTLLHGEAIVVGMIMEAYLSHKLCGLPAEDLRDITDHLLSRYPKVDLPEAAEEAMVNLLRFDKKNTHGKVQFVLLQEIAKPQIDREVPSNLLAESFSYYREA